MKRMHIKRKHRINILMFIVILIVGTLFISFQYLNKKSKTIFMDYSIIETKKIISKVIVDSIDINNINTNDLFIILKNKDDTIESIDINSKYINYILNNTTNVLDKNLNKLENDKSIFMLPLFNNTVISNIFPKIPVRINIIGNTLCLIDTKIESYGINNALFKIDLNVKLDIRILLPFVSKITTVETNIPIVIKLIEGKIPSYYFSDYFNKTYSN